MKKLFLLTILLAGLMACSNEDNTANEQPAEAQVYHVSIPAWINVDPDAQTRAIHFGEVDGMPDCDVTFETTDIIMVYNQTKGAWLEGSLRPTNLSNNDHNCNLTGELTGVAIEPGDELMLHYGCNVPYPEGYGFGYFFQRGTKETLANGALSTVKVSNDSSPKKTTASTAYFYYVDAMFNTYFVDEADNPITVHSLTISSKNNSLADFFMPCLTPDKQYTQYNYYIIPFAPTSDRLYYSICFNDDLTNGSDELTFIVDDGSYIYRGKKPAPEEGFMNGLYYYSSNPVRLTKIGAPQAPTVTWTRPSTEPTPASNHYYTTCDANIDITLSGTCFGYAFCLVDIGDDNAVSTVRMNGITATYYNDSFIYAQRSAIMDITGANSLICLDAQSGIFIDDFSGDQYLKLRGNGTLTITSKLSDYCGILSNSNYNLSNNGHAITTDVDVSAQLAADGYTVTRSTRTDNADGTYTWTYTVAPI